MSTSEPSGSSTDGLRASAAQAERLHAFAHALRNKLTGLIEALRFVQEQNDPAQRSEVAGFGERQFFQALREVEALMDDLGVARGAINIEPAPMDMAGVLHEAIALCEARYKRKDQRIRSIVPEILPLSGDRHLLLEAAQALLSNASKFSPRGAEVELHAACTDGTIIVRVSDTGVGLSQDDLRDAFTRFAWLDSTSTDGEAQGRSTLARVNQWIEAHGGSITAQSEGPGRGTTFTMRLPIGKA